MWKLSIILRIPYPIGHYTCGKKYISFKVNFQFMKIKTTKSYFLGALRDNVAEEDLEQYFSGI